MLNTSSIKFRLVALAAGISIILLVVLGVVVPMQTKKLSSEIIKENAAFIANLLSDNLSLGMQTMVLDDGESLKKTIKLLKSNEKETLIADIAVFDNDGEFVQGMTDNAKNISHEKTEHLIIKDQNKSIIAYSPMFDQSKNVLGHVTMVFSKKSFLKKIGNFSVSLWIITALLLGITVFIILLISSSIVKSLSKTTGILKDIASGEGDLTKRISITSNDEIGSLSKWFNTFIEKLQVMIRSVKEYIQMLNDILGELPSVVTESSDSAVKLRSNTGSAKTAIDKVNVSFEDMGTSSKNMSASVDTVASAIEELNVSINEVAKSCHKEYSISEDANSQSKSALEVIDSLGKSAADIDRIIVVIEDIADQINLLALNASIEAASAGDAGKGFAVVANEVKELAKQTALATNEIKNKITAMQESTDSSVNAIRSIAKVIEEVSSISQTIVSAVEEQSSTTNEIANQISRTREEASSIAEGIGSSAKEISEVASNMEHVDQVANNNEENAKKNQSVVTQLSSFSVKLQEIVDQFKI